MVPSNAECLACYVLPNSDPLGLPNSDPLSAGGSDGLRLMEWCPPLATSANRHLFGNNFGGADLYSVIFNSKGGNMASIAVVYEGGVPITNAHPCSPCLASIVRIFCSPSLLVSGCNASSKSTFFLWLSLAVYNIVSLVYVDVVRVIKQASLAHVGPAV
ncbi:hypothetical protein PIB30_019544 [Stylosanthes scabra]|uniref:Uncharacterized protein n=1 Tax=Stylosanthes scabra TaxID=79078 RepID=A0ABU6W7Z7_9FABA|nr:hypothetical protein [Stylosanthes scabra]